MLPIVFSLSVGAPSAIRFDSHQELEILMTIGQSLVGMIFLVNMELLWWEAAALFGLWFGQFLLSPIKPDGTLFGDLAGHAHEGVTVIYFLWFAVEVIRTLTGKRAPAAFTEFRHHWRTHIRPAGPA
jgi:hypothetical protein